MADAAKWRRTWFWTIVGVLVAGSGGTATAQAGPEYANDETRDVVERMVAAHGGFDRWISAPSLRFTAGMYLAALPVNGERSYYDNWRYYTVTVEPRSSRGMVELPLESDGGPSLAFDGHELWAREYTFDPSFRDSPFQLLYMHYGMISLPWLTQLPEVSLRLLGREALPQVEGRLDVVEMRFRPSGHEHGGYFRLFIDPQTHRLRGFTQTVTYPHLPGNAMARDLQGSPSPGGMVRIIDAYVEVDGLVLPRSYVTLRLADGETQVVGVHLVIDPSFSTPLDPGALAAPPDGRVLRPTSP